MKTKTVLIALLILLCLMALQSPVSASIELTMTLSYDTQQGAVRALTVYDDKLYAATSKYSEWGRIYVYDGSAWTLDYTLPGPAIEQNTVWALAEYDGKMYAGAGSILGDAGVIYVYDPTDGWSIAYDTTEDQVLGFGVYDGKLYAGTSIQGLVYVYDGITWDIAYDVELQLHVRCFAEYGGKLYAGTEYPYAAIYAYDGAEWSEAWSSTDDYGVLSLTVYDGKLYAGTSDRGLIYVFDGTNWSVAFDSPEYAIWPLAVCSGMLFAGTYGPDWQGLIYVFDGTEWELACDMTENYASSLAGYRGKLYAGMHGGKIYVSQILAISATIDIDPDTLNLVSNGQWITAYIELPSGYDVADIDVASIELSCDTYLDVVDPDAPTEIGDYDGDGIPDLMVKFDRLALVGYLQTSDFDDADGKFYYLPITITGLVAGTPFGGTDTIRVRI